jgi:hypothetical protein
MQYPMSDTRRKHGWPYWFAVRVILLPILYFGSFLGAVWLDNYDYLPDSIGPPLVWLYGPNSVLLVPKWQWVAIPYGSIGVEGGPSSGGRNRSGSHQHLYRSNSSASPAGARSETKSTGA